MCHQDLPSKLPQAVGRGRGAFEIQRPQRGWKWTEGHCPGGTFYLLLGQSELGPLCHRGQLGMSERLVVLVMGLGKHAWLCTQCLGGTEAPTDAPRPRHGLFPGLP